MLSVTVKALYCAEQPAAEGCGADSSVLAQISYQDVEIAFTINTAVTINFEDVSFSSTELLISGCTEHFCAHCHNILSLYEQDAATHLTATGHNFGDLTTPPFSDTLNLANCGASKGWRIEDADEALSTKFWLFSLDHESAKLNISKSKFADWRFR